MTQQSLCAFVTESMKSSNLALLECSFRALLWRFRIERERTLQLKSLFWCDARFKTVWNLFPPSKNGLLLSHPPTHPLSLSLSPSLPPLSLYLSSFLSSPPSVRARALTHSCETWCRVLDVTLGSAATATRYPCTLACINTEKNWQKLRLREKLKAFSNHCNHNLPMLSITNDQ